MKVITKQFIVNEKNEKVAAQIDIENHALVQLIKENESEPALELDEAKRYYHQLKKAQ